MWVKKVEMKEGKSTHRTKKQNGVVNDGKIKNKKRNICWATSGTHSIFFLWQQALCNEYVDKIFKVHKKENVAAELVRAKSMEIVVFLINLAITVWNNIIEEDKPKIFQE